MAENLLVEKIFIVIQRVGGSGEMKDMYSFLFVLLLVVAIASCVAWQFGPKPEWTPYTNRINQHGGGAPFRKNAPHGSSRSREMEPNSVAGTTEDMRAYPDQLDEDAKDQQRSATEHDPMFTPLSQLSVPKL